jgi:ribosome-associated heat shock protein Hsp15
MEREQPGTVRLDKWLWAARFYKTRALAVEAIEGGKVEVNDDKAKRAKAVRLGDRVRLRLGPYEWRLVIRGLSERRGPAPEAQKLYEEEEEGRKLRERHAEQLKLAHQQHGPEKGRPTKKDRRELEKWRKGWDE